MKTPNQQEKAMANNTRINSMCRYHDGPYGLTLDWYFISKRTPKGVWIQVGYKQFKFILNDSIKKWAHLNTVDAKVSFLARKRRQKAILEGQLKSIARAVEHINKSEVGQLGNYPRSTFDHFELAEH